MEVRKYQAGGGAAFTPFVPTRVTTDDSSKKSTGSTSEKITGTMTKEIIESLREEGIPIDVDTLLSDADSFLSRSKHLSMSSIFGGTDTDYSLSDLIRIQSKANQVAYNKKLRETAYNRLESEYSWGEVALDSRGQLYVYNEKDGLKTVSPTEYYNNQDKYQILTNSDLMGLREHKLAFNSTVLNDLSASVGMKTITEYLKGIIKDFGKTTVQGYATKDSNHILNGFQQLMMNGPDGYYKEKSEDQLRDINTAVSYLYNALPENMKRLLRAKTAAEGGDPSSSATHSLIIQALTEHTSNSRTVDFDSSATTEARRAAKEDAESLTEEPYLMQVGNMQLAQTMATIVPRANSPEEVAALSVPVYQGGVLIDKSNKAVGLMNLNQLNKDAEALKAADMTQVTFGSKHLTEDELGGLVYDGVSQLNIAMLPYTTDDKGRIVPDFELIAGYNKIQELRNRRPQISQLELRNEAAKLGIEFDEIYDYDTNSITLRPEMLRPFAMFTCYAGDDTIDINKKDPFLEKLDADQGSRIAGPYNNSVRFNTTNPTKQMKVANKGFGKSGKRDFYRGNVYIPMNDPAISALLSGKGPYQPKSSFNNFPQRSWARQVEVADIMNARANDPNYLENTQIGQFK